MLCIQNIKTNFVYFLGEFPSFLLDYPLCSDISDPQVIAPQVRKLCMSSSVRPADLSELAEGVEVISADNHSDFFHCLKLSAAKEPMCSDAQLDSMV
jgi:hypothetical protein